MNEFICNGHSFQRGNKTFIMGILNVTPDSFSDGGKYNSLTAALKHTEKMLEEGADIIDVGAVSTRPFSTAVDENEEWQRLEKILYEIKKNFNVCLSVDTVSPAVAEKSLALGVDIINDVSGIFLGEMAEAIKKYNCGWILMHGGIGLRRAESVVEFENGIVADVNSFFSDMVKKVRDCGISEKRLCLDAGFGFSKTNEQTIELLKNYEAIDFQSCLSLCALSRKRFISTLSGEADSERLMGTVSANIAAVIKGADLVRVHDVAAHRKALDACDKRIK